jgi:hypothetical protein
MVGFKTTSPGQTPMPTQIYECQCEACQQSKDHADWQLHHQMNVFFSRLDEQQRRWYVALESKRIGRSGDKRLSEITGMDVETIRRGRRELDEDLTTRLSEDIREAGGWAALGQKKDPTIQAALVELLQDETAGDPMSEQKWSRSSLRHLADELSQIGHWVSHTTVAKFLKDMGYSLKANVKRLAGSSHPDQDRQFEYTAQQKKAFLEAGLPVISVDTKKKELIGNFKNAGQSWCQEPIAVNDHDFEQDTLGKAVPYGIYDLKHNRGYVYVGKSADTSQFAVEMIARWWGAEGKTLYPNADKLLILADAGGSNGCRPRLWKLQLQEDLADRMSLEVTVCHYPTGASKWNPIEHRLFGPISVNWAGKPLRTFEIMLAYIRGTNTDTGLQVKAFLVEDVYQKGIQVTQAVMQSLQIHYSENRVSREDAKAQRKAIFIVGCASQRHGRLA